MSGNVNKSKRGLGRGLSALISSSQAVPVQEAPSEEKARSPLPSAKLAQTSKTDSASDRDIQYLAPSELKPNPKQPRTFFTEAEIDELSRSVKELGVIQPVLVRKHEDKFEIVAGERRWRAANKAGLSQLPVIIRDLTDKECLEIAIVENVQRSDLSPIEEGRAYLRLSKEFGLSQEEIAQRVSKDRSSVSNAMRLLKLPESVCKMIEQGEISQGHAKAILTVKEPAAQENLARKVIDEGLSVRSLEEIVGRVVVLDKKQKKKKTKTKTQFPELRERLQKTLGTKVRIQHQSTGRGKIEIDYFSEEELDRLIELLS